MIDYNKPITNKDGNPLRILMASHHSCIRVIKRMRALKKLGYAIDGFAHKPAYGVEEFDIFSLWHNERQFKNYIADNMDKYDIIDYSNEPDHPVKWIKDVVGNKKKIIVDVHDLDSVRRGVIPIPERDMFNCADSLIYVSMPIQKMTNKLHKLNIPSIVLYSYCNENTVEYAEEDIPKRHHIIYEGGANPPNDDIANREFAYRSLYDIIKRLVEMGNETHMFCGNITAFSTYQDTGAILYPPTDYDKMMEALIKFKYGILIFNNKDGQKQQVNYTLTNKESEYLHAGLPALTCWCPESEKHVKKHGIGFVFSDIEEIGNCSQLEDQYRQVMNNIKTKRKELVMENYIVLYENLVADTLGLEKKGIPENIQKIHDFEFNE